MSKTDKNDPSQMVVLDGVVELTAELKWSSCRHKGTKQTAVVGPASGNYHS